MKQFVKYIVQIIISLLKRAWYYAKMKALKEELQKEKEEANEAVKHATDAVDDFESAYRVLKQSEDKKSDDSGDDDKNSSE